MQELLAELIRWFGYLALRIITLGRYTGGKTSDEVLEGAFGLLVIAAVAFVVYSIGRPA
jgi:hypothetical protein